MNPPTAGPNAQSMYRRPGGGFGFGPRPTPLPYPAIDAYVRKRVDELLPAQAAALEAAAQVPASNEASAEVLAGLQLAVEQLRVDVDALMGLPKG